MNNKDKWDELKLWVQNYIEEYKSGIMMSFAESVHGEINFKKVLNKMNDLEKGENK